MPEMPVGSYFGVCSFPTELIVYLFHSYTSRSFNPFRQ